MCRVILVHITNSQRIGRSSFNFEDAKFVLQQWLEYTNSNLIDISFKDLTLESTHDTLVDLRDRMRKEEIVAPNLQVPLACYDGNVHEVLRLYVNTAPGTTAMKHKSMKNVPKTNPNETDIKTEVHLQRETSDRFIYQWSPNRLGKMLHRGFALGKLPMEYNHYLTMKAYEMRLAVIAVRNHLRETKDDTVLCVRDIYSSTVNKDTQEWEIAAFSRNERRILFNLLNEYLELNEDISKYSSNDIQFKLSMFIQSEAFQTKGGHVIALFTCETPPEVIAEMSSSQNKTTLKFSKVTPANAIYDWPPRVLVTLLLEIDPNHRRYRLMSKSSEVLREMVLSKLQQMEEEGSEESFEIERYEEAFFSQRTLDWEINNYSEMDTRILQRKLLEMGLAKDTKLNGVSTIFQVHQALKYIRDDWFEDLAATSISITYSDIKNYKSQNDGSLSMSMYNKEEKNKNKTKKKKLKKLQQKGEW